MNKNSIVIIVLLVLVSLPTYALTQDEARDRLVHLTPKIVFSDSGKTLVGEAGFIVVPENRTNPDSRQISVHFQRYPALNKKSDRAPVFLLPGGPGSDYNFDDDEDINFVNTLRRTRDLVVVSQRGNPNAPGFSPDMRIRYKRDRQLDRPASVDETSRRYARAYRNALRTWSDAGVDVRGYDIFNIVDDVYDIREALGYEKLVLRGCSFGSQWSFSYLKRWPDTVERAMLSGVEPLDYAYDSAKWLWASMHRLAAQADADADLSDALPSGGLMKALETVVLRLSEDPVTVSVLDPTSGNTVDIVVGADDLRLGAIQNFRTFGQGSDLKNLALWPHFILDMYNGDFRALGLMALISRRQTVGWVLIGPMIDNSLGISPARDALLLDEVERQWIEPNWVYRSTREIEASPKVPADFLSDWTVDVPVLLVSGEFDWSTPIENAMHAEEFLTNGKLVTVNGATHCPLIGKPDQLQGQDPKIHRTLNDFIHADLSNEQKIQRYFNSLPENVALAPIDFESAEAITVYDEMLKSAAP